MVKVTKADFDQNSVISSLPFHMKLSGKFFIRLTFFEPTEAMDILIQK